MVMCCGAAAVADAETPSSAGVGVADALAAVTPLVDDSMQIPAPQASSVQVVVRVRPMIEREAGLKSSSVMDVTSPQNLRMIDDPSGRSKASSSDREFAFDRVLGQGAGQAEAYAATAQGILLKVLAGYNGCIFAYGQTGSGKTFTMEGEGSTAKDATATAASAATTSASTGGKGANAEALPAGAGVIPRMCSELFSRLTLMANGQDGLAGTSAAAAASPGAGKPGTNTTGPRWRWTLSAQYIEIYLEKLTDLLTPASSNSNAVRTTTDAGVASPNATGQKDGTSSSSSSAQSARKGGENTSSAASAASPTTGDDNGDGTGPSIHQKPDGSIYVDGVTSRAVRSQNDISAILSEGQSRRTKGETNMNAASSRSHAVLTLSLTLTRVDGGAGGDGSVDEDDAGSTPSTPAAPGAAATSPGKNSKPANSKVAPSSAGASLFTRTCKLHLIDLAGSERAEATGATGARLKEGAKINLSLSALGNVINALTTPGRAHIPYRDSKLTRLLQDSLGGNAFTCMVCCVSPASVNYDESLASLRFAERAKRVKNVARINVDPAAARIAALMEENRGLKAKLAAFEAAMAKRGLPIDPAQLLQLPAPAPGGDTSAAGDGQHPEVATAKQQKPSGGAAAGCVIM